MNEPTDDGSNVVHVTEEWLRETYYPYVLGRLAQLGREPITFEQCVEEWLVCNWGWEVTA